MWVDLAASGFEAALVVDNLAISDWQLAISQTARYLVFGSWYLVNLSVEKTLRATPNQPHDGPGDWNRLSPLEVEMPGLKPQKIFYRVQLGVK
jgi:hypothetical protein